MSKKISIFSPRSKFNQKCYKGESGNGPCKLELWVKMLRMLFHQLMEMAYFCSQKLHFEERLGPVKSLKNRLFDTLSGLYMFTPSEGF